MAAGRMRDAVRVLLEHLPEGAPTVLANGYIAREAYNVEDRPEHFYMLGSMGLGGAIGFGIAHARPDRPVVILDGDGNVLMGLGGLALIGAYAPANLYHVCLDNGVYASTGNQAALSRKVALERFAEAAGYRRAFVVESLDALREALPGFFGEPGPVSCAR